MKIKPIIIVILACCILPLKPAFSSNGVLKAATRECYQLIIYHIKDKIQETRVDNYLSQAYLPALHRSGIPAVGVFKQFGIDTAVDKKIYVLIPFASVGDFYNLQRKLEKDKQLASKGADYINATYNNPPFLRKESILMQAFSGMPKLKKPTLTSAIDERIYELRSYESATEKIYQNKVQMFNEGEMEIFERIGSKPVFYGEVLAGSRTPNLMYMTSYNNMASRDAQWKTFGSDPKWKAMSALPEYQNNTSEINVQFLTPAAYSDL